MTLASRTPVVWQPSYRIIPARHAPVAYFERAADPATALRNLRLAAFTDATVGGVADAYLGLPPEDRLSGPGSGLIMPSFVFPASPGRFSSGTRDGTYYAAADLPTATAETTFHYAYELESSPAALARALAAGAPPRRTMQVVAADVLAVCVDLRGRSDIPSLYDPDPAGYAAGAGHAIEADVRRSDVDGVVYDSVRRLPDEGWCVAIYRPRAVRSARVALRLRYSWRGPGTVSVDDA